MSKTITATELRRDVYRILDEVLESGVPLEVARNGQRLVILPAAPVRHDLEDLPKRRARNCTFDELVETSWVKAWRPDP